MLLKIYFFEFVIYFESLFVSVTVIISSYLFVSSTHRVSIDSIYYHIGLSADLFVPSKNNYYLTIPN